MTESPLKYLIIGAGITGVSLARLLQQRGETRFLLIEKEPEPGGLCRTRKIGGHVLDIGGGHFFCTKYPEVAEFVFSHIAEDRFLKVARVSKVEVENVLVDYPVESNLWQLPDPLRVEYLRSLLEAATRYSNKEPTCFLEWIRSRLGNRIADKYMIPYNAKIWGLDPSQLDVDWLHKIPRLSPEEVERSCVQRDSQRDKFPSHQSFYYPTSGGFQEIFDAICEHVRDAIVLNTPVQSLERERKNWVVNQRWEAETVINTAPWPSLAKALQPGRTIQECFLQLRASSLVVSLVESEYQHDDHWRYVADPEVKHHREFFIHNFAPHSRPDGIFLETNLNRWRKGESVSRFQRLPVYEHVNEFAYPIPAIGHANAIAAIRQHYAEQNLFGVGRWGQWSFYNSDVCVREAMELVKNIAGE